MDYREKYRERIKKEEEISQINRVKRDIKKNKQKKKSQIEFEKLKNYSTGLILWSQKGYLPEWNGYIGKTVCFNIKQGIYKYTLSVLIDTGDKKDKNLKTSFELNKLQNIAESIAIKFLKKSEDNNEK
jgi:dolichyl-phosphate-mannose--protein O-mannosyl transferase